jgi:site-specific recombinase XerD
MRRHRGSSEETLRGYCLVLRAFLFRVGDDARGYNAHTLRSFVLDYGRGRGKLVPQAMRQFLRFLITEGLCPVDLDKAIPTVAHWRLSSLPRYLPREEVERVIAAAAGRTRDQAMLLLMSRLGLRNGDLRELRLGDIDWQRGRIRVVGKSRCEALLPLPQDVGDALLAYIETERQPAPSDHMFFRKAAPIRPLGRDTARGVVRSSLRRAGIDDPPSRGCHLLRHSAATDMLRRGMPLEDIGVLLRHRFRETTAIYAKVDINALREVAQPWPLVAA